MCPTCGRRLSRSVYRGPANAMKSCPNCSKKAGRHVFYSADSFGNRTMADGHVIIQSWCGPCRSDDAPSNYAITC